MSEINRHYKLNRKVPDVPEKVIREFPIWLTFVPLKSRMVIVIDGLNYLDSDNNALELAWLPEYFPPNVRVIVSASPGNSLEALKKRGWKTLIVKEMSLDEKRQFILNYLSIYGKSLDENLNKKIILCNQTSIPLFLKVLLDELRVFGRNDELGKKIDFFLSCENINIMYYNVLGRLEEDYEEEMPGLVGDVLSLLWASRDGLSESELLEIMEFEGKPIPKYCWSALHLALEDILVNRINLLNFSNDYIRRAVEARYLKNNDRKVNCHIRISTYFEKCSEDERKIFELPWQLEKAEEWEKLKNYILDPVIFTNLASKEKRYDLLRYWRALSNIFDIVALYEKEVDFLIKLNSPTQIIRKFLYQIAFILELNSMNQAAENFYLRAMVNWESSGETENPEYANILNNIGNIYKDKGEYQKAKELHQRALNIRKRTHRIHSC